MADTGWVMAGTGANDAAYGTNAFTSPENVTADDGSIAISYSNSGTPRNTLRRQILDYPCQVDQQSLELNFGSEHMMAS